jgi:hypothetical protein
MKPLFDYSVPRPLGTHIHYRFSPVEYGASSEVSSLQQFPPNRNMLSKSSPSSALVVEIAPKSHCGIARQGVGRNCSRLSGYLFSHLADCGTDQAEI